MSYSSTQHSFLTETRPLPKSGKGIDRSPVMAAMNAPPVDTTYVMGRWHEDRISWRGILVEAKVFGKSLVTDRNSGVRKFLIIGRARSGTTLLRSLLDAHSDVTCEGEVLGRRTLDPVGHLERLAAKSSGKAWGAKLLSYQMVQVQRFREPTRLLADLHERGYLLVHLVRETFFQTLSLTIAQQSHRYHDSTGGKPFGRKHVLDPEDFVRRLKWNDLLLRYEQHCLGNIPHVQVFYERDLLDPERQAETAERLFRAIGVPAAPVTSNLRKILPTSPVDILDNYAEISAALKMEGLEHLLPADAP
jgi:hypothetical protein